MKKRKFWTKEENRILINSWSNMRDEDVAELLPNRSLASIDLHCRRYLKLTKDKEHTKRIKSENMSGKNNPRYGKAGTMLGRNQSEEAKKKLREKKLGSIGLRGDKNPMYGKVAYNRGVPPSPESIRRANESRMRTYNELSDSEKLALKLKRAGEIISRIKKMNKRPTLPEKKVSELLKSLNVEFECQKKIDYYMCDYVIGRNVIEVQGDYWHANPIRYSEKNLTEAQRKNIHRDKCKNSFLVNRGYKILYLWERDLIKNYSMCEDLVKQFLNLKIIARQVA